MGFLADGMCCLAVIFAVGDMMILSTPNFGSLKIGREIF